MAWLALGLLEMGREVRLGAVLCPPEIEALLPPREEPEALLREGKTVILPVPTMGKEGGLRLPEGTPPLSWERAVELLTESTLVLAGGVPPPQRKTAEERGLCLIDLLERPELMELSAIATAEGAVALAMKELCTTLFGTPCMVVGYGRCGSALARRLAALGAEVTATARRPEQLARIYADGFTPCSTARLAEKAGSCGVIFNTVPAQVLGEKELEALRPGTVLIELASEPGGIDREAAERLHVPWIAAPGLPGKVAPRTAGEQLLAVVTALLEEREE